MNFALHHTTIMYVRPFVRPLRSVASVLLLASLMACGQAGTKGTATAKPAAPSATPFVFGEVHTLRSTILGQDRVINVYLPDGYAADSAATFPVIYVLDGSANEDFPHIAGLAQFMNMYDLLPRSIVVGIANVDRKHDFTHPTELKADKELLPTSGGSAAFIRFIGEELQPFVADHYRTSGTRTIIGQSLGGLLATEILIKAPDLFEQYIIVSPSLWWDGGSLVGQVEGWMGTHVGLEKKVYLSLGKEGDEMQQYMDTLVAAFSKGSQPPFTWWFVPFPDETHATILHRSVYRAFELINWKEGVK